MAWPKEAGYPNLRMLVVSVTAPPANLRDPQYMEQLLRTLHRIEFAEPLELQIRNDAGHVQLAMAAPAELMPLLRAELADVYPGLRTKRIGVKLVTGHRRLHFELTLTPDLLPMRTFSEFGNGAKSVSDPIAGLFSVVRGNRVGKFSSRIRLLIRPAGERRVNHSAWLLNRCLRRGKDWPTRLRWIRGVTSPNWIRRFQTRLRLRWQTEHESSSDENKLTGPLFECRLILEVDLPAGQDQTAHRLLQTTAASFGRFHGPDTRFRPVRSRSFGRSNFLLTTQEISTLWHPPMESTDAVAGLLRTEFRELPPPVSIASKKESAGMTVLGRVAFRGQRNTFGIEIDDLRRHLITVGSTGCGKSVLLMNIVRQQIDANRGIILIDPHGQLVEDVLEHIPRRRTNDVVLLDASDRERPVGFNPLVNKYSDPNLVADAVVTAFSSVFGFDAGSAPRMLHIFRNCLLTLIGRPDASLASVQRLLTDDGYRRSVLPSIQDEVVRSFWQAEFQQWNNRDRTLYIASLQNKLGAFLTNPQLRAILCPSRNSIDLREIMDSRRILLCNLSKGTIGDEASTLLGALLLSSLHTAAMSRADTPERERVDSIIVVDEFHSFLSEGNQTMATAMSESRKYRTSYVLATQFLSQLDEATRASILGNTGSLLSMRVGPQDAKILADLIGQGLTPEDLMQIPRFHGYIRALMDGSPRSFSMATQPPPKRLIGRGSIVRSVSRSRFGSG